MENLDWVGPNKKREVKKKMKQNENKSSSRPTATVLECRDLIEIKEHTVTIPESIMKKLDLKEGDELEFITEGNGVILRKK